MQEVERRKMREEQQHKDRGRDLCQEDVQPGLSARFTAL